MEKMMEFTMTEICVTPNLNKISGFKSKIKPKRQIDAIVKSRRFNSGVAFFTCRNIIKNIDAEKKNLNFVDILGESENLSFVEVNPRHRRSNPTIIVGMQKSLRESGKNPNMPLLRASQLR